MSRKFNTGHQTQTLSTAKKVTNNSSNKKVIIKKISSASFKKDKKPILIELQSL